MEAQEQEEGGSDMSPPPTPQERSPPRRLDSGDLIDPDEFFDAYEDFASPRGGKVERGSLSSHSAWSSAPVVHAAAGAGAGAGALGDDGRIRPLSLGRGSLSPTNREGGGNADDTLMPPPALHHREGDAAGSRNGISIAEARMRPLPPVPPHPIPSPNDSDSDTPVESDFKYMVINKDTGEAFDLRDGENAISSVEYTTFLPGKEWQPRPRAASGGSEREDPASGKSRAPSGAFTKVMKGLGRGKRRPAAAQGSAAAEKPRFSFNNKKEGGFFSNFMLFQELKTESKPPAREGERGIGGPIWALEFSLDGRFVAWGGEDGRVIVHELVGGAGDGGGCCEDMTTVELPGRKERVGEPGSPIPAAAAAGGPGSSPAQSSTTGSRSQGAGAGAGLNLLSEQPLRVFMGHTSDVIALCWSKNNFILSASTDKTVRLWHTSKSHCLHCFQHTEIVTAVDFHPLLEHFFLTGCFDKKIRIWNIKNGRVYEWQQAQDMVTAARFSSDGAMVIAGLFKGQVLFYQTEGMRYFTQIECRNRRGPLRKGKKVTGFAFRSSGKEPSTSGAVARNMPNLQVLVSTNDSRLRLFQTDDFSMVSKYKGLANDDYLIRATFSEDGQYIISGSENGKVYVWPIDSSDKDTLKKGAIKNIDSFPAGSTDSAIVTTTHFVPETAVRACVAAFRGSTKPETAESGGYMNAMVITSDNQGVVRVWAQQSAFFS
jgi:WD40 repeat protein